MLCLFPTGRDIPGEKVLRYPVLPAVAMLLQVIGLCGIVPGRMSLVGIVFSDIGILFFILWMKAEKDELKIYAMFHFLSFVVAILLLAMQRLQFVSIPAAT